MKMTLSDDDRNRLDALVTDVEQRTNTQIVLAVIQRCDNYAELPWKSFAFGSSFTSLLVFFLDLLFYDWYPGITVTIALAGILCVGVFLALLTVLLPEFAKRFLSAVRAEVEVKQYADSLFLSRELFATSNRTGILMLISLFERKVVILPDKGLIDQLPKDVLQSIIAAMTLHLKQKEISRAFETGMEKLSQILGTNGKEPGKNELSDDIIEEKGV